MKLRFSIPYFILAVLIFAVEVLIAVYVHDDFVRPYIGDVLVVILIYCVICSFLEAPVIPVALSVLVFSYLVETLQYFNVVKMLGLEHSRVARIVIGSTFTWEDMFCYTVGIGVTVLVERYA